MILLCFRATEDRCSTTANSRGQLASRTTPARVAEWIVARLGASVLGRCVNGGSSAAGVLHLAAGEATPDGPGLGR